LSKSRIIRLVLILVVAGVAYWQCGRVNNRGGDSQKPTAVLKEEPLGSKNSKSPTATLKKNPLGNIREGVEKVRGYDKITGARLLKRDDNDGDSFFVNAVGREFQLRLYFVDAPEKYLSDRYEKQRQRVAEQAREMGGISSEQAVEVGKAAKMFVDRELSGKPFTIYTYWEQVYDGDRYYGFVELPDGSYLGTRLVEQGLVRIHTKGPGSKEKPVPTPDGKSFHQHRDKLYDLELKAQRNDAGAWGL
jgi:endonuclease YncB( thermonuclease family)